MSLAINANVSSLNAQNNLNKTGRKKNEALEKLSSGLRINKGADDPAGLIISELLRSQISGYNRALRNTQETNNVMSIAEGGLSSVGSMLTNMRGLAIQALNSGVTSGGQLGALQAELNSSLQTIQRVVSTTNYAGANLLDGTQDFTFGVDDASGMLNAAGTSIAGMSGASSDAISVSYSGDAANQTEKAYLEADFGGAASSTAQEFIIAGNAGSRQFSFAAGVTVEDMAEQINNAAASTGVNAYAVRDSGSGATTLRLTSAEYGSDQEVRVRQITGTAFGAEGSTSVDRGRDAQISVNGSSVSTRGLVAGVADSGLNATIAFNTGSADATTIAQTGYDQDELVDAAAARDSSLTGIRGGMRLQLGEGAGGQNRESVSLGNYNPAVLGSVVRDGRTYSLNDLYGGGAAALSNDPELALRIIDQAIADVASGRAGIGAYQANTLETNANNLMVAIENTTALESSIRDADMAEAITLFIKNKLLENASLKGVQNSKINASSVTSLLNGL